MWESERTGREEREETEGGGGGRRKEVGRGKANHLLKVKQLPIDSLLSKTTGFLDRPSKAMTCWASPGLIPRAGMGSSFQPPSTIEREHQVI